MYLFINKVLFDSINASILTVTVGDASGGYECTVVVMVLLLLLVLFLAKMVTVVCDESKIMVLLEQFNKCPKLKNIVKIAPLSMMMRSKLERKLESKLLLFKN